MISIHLYYMSPREISKLTERKDKTKRLQFENFDLNTEFWIRKMTTETFYNVDAVGAQAEAERDAELEEEQRHIDEEVEDLIVVQLICDVFFLVL